MSHDARLAELKIVLPEALAPVANYVPYQLSGNLLFISGQISNGADGLIRGKLGDDMDVAAGAAAARTCGLTARMTGAKQAVRGDLGRPACVPR